MDIRAARTWRNRRTATLRALGDGGHIQALTTAHSGLRVVLEDGQPGECAPAGQVNSRAGATSSPLEGSSDVQCHGTALECFATARRRDVQSVTMAISTSSPGPGGCWWDTIVGIGGQGGGIRISVRFLASPLAVLSVSTDVERSRADMQQNLCELAQSWWRLLQLEDMENGWRERFLRKECVEP